MKFFPLLFVIVAAVLVAAEPNSPVSGAVTTSAAVVASSTPASSLPAAQGAGANATPSPTPALIPDADAAEVLCVGDSITQKRYPSLLQQLLGKRFRVVDAGHSGTTALRDGNRPYRYDQMKDKPRYVIIMLGTNDAKSINWTHSQNFRQDMCNIVRFFKASSPQAKVFVALPPPIFREKPEWPGKNMEEIVAILPKVAADTGTTLIDVHAATIGKPELFPRDGVHPSDDGNAVIARLMFEAIKKNP